VEEGEIKEKVEEASKSTISRREFLKDAGLIVGGATVGSMAVLSACSGGTVTETVTAPGGTSTVTNTVTTTITNTTGGTVTTTMPPITQIVEVQSGPPSINMMVNGKNHVLTATPTETLRDVLRERLGLTSIKDMCSGYGACGSCSVIMNGRPILSCMVIACECEGAVIETAEGIAESKHPLVDAYVVNQCMQCGYCTPGFIVTAKALLDHKPKPTEDDIRDILGGNICRCGTYPAHIRAVLEVAK
jgi:aerobic-type carbon monoxide dehydrogenase small subunit (CoxS/CutS family)